MASLTDNEDETANSHSRNPSQTLSYISLSRTDPHVQTPLLQPYEPNETAHEHESSNPPIPSRTVDIGILPSFGTTNRPPHPRIILDLRTLEEKPQSKRAHLVNLKLSDESPDTFLRYRTARIPAIPFNLYVVNVGSSQEPQAQPPADALAYSGLNILVHTTRETVIANAIVGVSDHGEAGSNPSWTFDSACCVDHENLTI